MPHLIYQLRPSEARAFFANLQAQNVTAERARAQRHADRIAARAWKLKLHQARAEARQEPDRAPSREPRS